MVNGRLDVDMRARNYAEEEWRQTEREYWIAYDAYMRGFADGSAPPSKRDQIWVKNMAVYYGGDPIYIELKKGLWIDGRRRFIVDLKRIIGASRVRLNVVRIKKSIPLSREAKKPRGRGGVKKRIKKYDDNNTAGLSK